MTVNRWRCLAAVTFIWQIVSTQCVGCATTNMGTSFLLAFPDGSNVENDAYQLDIYPTSFGPWSSVDVDVVAYGNLPTGDSWNSSFDYVPGKSLVVGVPPSAQMNGVGLATRAVFVHTAKAVAVFAASWSRSRASCDGFLVFPVDALGTDYFTVNFFPSSDQSELTVVAVEDGTTVDIEINNYTRPYLVVAWKGKNYTQGSVIRVAINRHEVVQLQNGRDLSGTRITSDKPVAVFSGNTEKNGTDGEHVVEQMPPIEQWGSTFYLVTLPGFGGTYNFKYISATPNNSVTITTPTGQRTYEQTLDQGAFYPRGSQSYATATTLVTIRASGRLLVAQFAGNSKSIKDSPPVDVRQHAMMVVPPVELFQPSYSFSTGPNPVANFTHYLIVVVNGSAVGGLLLDGLPVDSTGWEPFDVTGEDPMVGRSIVVDAGVHLIEQADGVPFGAYVYGYAKGVCSYAYAAGSCLGRPDNLSAYHPFTSAAPSSTTAQFTDTMAGTAAPLPLSASTTAPASQASGWQITVLIIVLCVVLPAIILLITIISVVVCMKRKRTERSAEDLPGAEIAEEYDVIDQSQLVQNAYNVSQDNPSDVHAYQLLHDNMPATDEGNGEPLRTADVDDRQSDKLSSSTITCYGAILERDNYLELCNGTAAAYENQ